LRARKSNLASKKEQERARKSKKEQGGVRKGRRGIKRKKEKIEISNQYEQ
jgi:hypothetical protein